MARKSAKGINRSRPIGQPLDIDAAVAAIATDQTPFGMGDKLAARQRKKAMTPGQRRKAEKDKERVRIAIDAPLSLDDLIVHLQTKEGVSKSRMACYLMILGLQKLLEDNIDFTDHKGPPNTPRVAYTLNLPEVPPIGLFTATFKNGDE